MSHNSRHAIFALLPMLLASSLGLAQEVKPQYSIKDEVRTGSNIRRDQVTGSKIAMNLPFEKLAAADRAQLNSLYEHIAEGDEPPFPLKGLQMIYDPLREVNNKLYDRGQLSMFATVDAEGAVQEVKLLQSPSPEMTKFAANILYLIRFKPAKCGGKACVMDFPVRLSFE